MVSWVDQSLSGARCVHGAAVRAELSLSIPFSMNKVLLTPILAMLPLVASAAPITLISASVSNGGFESGTGAYTTGTHWFNYGAGAETASVYTAPAQTGSYAGIVSLGSNPSIGTSWSISAGDVYNLSFGARSSNVGALVANPIRWELYYYTTQGEIGFDEVSATSGSVLFSGSITNSTVTANNTWANVSLGGFDTGTLSGATLEAAAGKELYLRFYRTAGDGSFPTIDNVTLTASAIPEPSTYGLLGAGSLVAVALVRRRQTRKSA